MFKMNKFDLIAAMYIFCVVASELMGGKTFNIVHIGGFLLSGSVAIFLFPITFAINDIIVEVKGKERAQSIVRSGIVIIILIILFSLLAVALPSTSRFLPTEAAYESVFKISIRFSIASLLAFVASEVLDVAIFYRLRQKLGKRKLWLRTNLSNFISQLVDTSTFMILAFYAIDKSINQNLIFILGLILPYWGLKCMTSIIETPFVYFGVKWLRKEIDEG